MKSSSSAGHVSQLSRGEFLRAAAAGSFALAGCAYWVQSDALRPNMVFFISDDHDAFYTACYGNPRIRTPRIDRLARDGLRFERAFTATAMCAPSRSMLYTGLFPHRNGAHPNHSSIRAGIKTLPQYLTELGYRVALAGKTHIKPESAFPFEYLELEDVEDFLSDAGAQPFCLIVASHEPHTPHKTGGYTPEEVIVHPALVDTPETRQRLADYCTDVDNLDGEVGGVLDLLDRYGFTDSTLFIYTSDHGGPFPFAKWTCYDSGLRVPFIARWPGRIKPDTTTDAMISFVDVLPTFIEMAGGRAPEDLDGRSFLSVLRGESDRHREFIFGTHTSEGISNGGFYPIRSIRTATRKYIVNLNPGGMFTNNITENGERFGPLWQSWIERAKTDAWAKERVDLYQHRPLEEFYALDGDPYELHNLAAAPGSFTEKAELRGRLADWMRRQRDPHLSLLESLFTNA